MSEGSEITVPQGLTDSQRQAIIGMADIRRGTQILGKNLDELLKNPQIAEAPDSLKTAYQQQHDHLMRVMTGDTTDPNLNEQKIASYVASAIDSQETDPQLAALYFAKAASAQQDTGQDYSEALDRSKDCLEKSEKQGIKKTTPADFLPSAYILGIAKRATQGVALPDPETVAAAIGNNHSLLADYALTLPEEERDRFLSSFSNTTTPSEQIKTIGARMDNALSQVVDVTEPQYQPMLDRTKQGLEDTISREIVQNQPNLDKVVVKLLADTLNHLGTREAKMVLRNVTQKAIESAGSLSDNSFNYAARLVRTLAEVDSYAGSSLAIGLMGQKMLPPRYFNYFRDYLQSKGLLTKVVDQAGKMWSETQCLELYNFLQNHEPAWQDNDNVTIPFYRGVKVFGIKRMLAYAGRPDVGPHDALFAFPDVLKLFERSGLPERVFSSNILEMIQRDNGQYDNGTSYHELNRIAQSLDLSDRGFETIRRKLARYSDIQALAGLQDYVTRPKEIFSSWKHLQQFTSLVDLLNQTNILEQLKVLETQAKNDPTKKRLYSFYEMLVLRKGSKVDAATVTQLWQHPEGFFERSDAQIEGNPRLKAIHQELSPNNYQQVPYLDLSVEEFRDALIDGTADRLQLFSPMEILYSVAEQERNVRQELSLHDQVVLQVGKRDEGTMNKKLFYQIKQIFLEKDMDVLAYLQGKKDVLDQLSLADQEYIEQAVRKALQDFPNPRVHGEHRIGAKQYRARMLTKGDPEAVSSNNDMANCMPFGSGKSNDYWTNQSVGSFTLEERRGNSWRTVAAIVVTPDVELDIPVQKLSSTPDNLSTLISSLPNSALSRERLISADNIERAPNDKSGEDFIRAMVGNFFRHYTYYLNERVAPLGLKFNTERMVVGQGYSDLRYGREEENKYLPSSLIGYSDKLGPKVDVIELQPQTYSGKVIVEEAISTKEDSVPKAAFPATGLLPLTVVDALAAAYIEGKAYPSDMQEGIIAIQNYISASRISNAIKDRPQLSLKYVDPNGIMRGYLTAWEGIMRGNPVVYIEDIAADPASTLAGGRLLQGFIEAYQKNYLSKGKLTPILVQAREETTYKILQKHLDQEAERLGIRLDVQNLREDYFGSSRMYHMLITPHK